MKTHAETGMRFVSRNESGTVCMRRINNKVSWLRSLTFFIVLFESGIACHARFLISHKLCGFVYENKKIGRALYKNRTIKCASVMILATPKKDADRHDGDRHP